MYTTTPIKVKESAFYFSSLLLLNVFGKNSNQEVRRQGKTKHPGKARLVNLLSGGVYRRLYMSKNNNRPNLWIFIALLIMLNCKSNSRNICCF